MMHVQVIPFGVLKDWLGSSAATVELPDGASVAELLERMRAMLPARAPANGLRGIAVSVNAEYAQATRILHDGDEVGLCLRSRAVLRARGLRVLGTLWTKVRGSQQ